MTVLTAATVIADGQARQPGWVDTRGDRIAGVGGGPPPRRADVELGDVIVVPGFVDMHVHGGAGGAYTAAAPDQAERAARFHRRHGTTTTLASLVTASPEKLHRAVAVLAELVQDGLLAGIHLEGPWLSAARCGAHDRQQLRDPDPAELGVLLRTGRDTIRMVTIAPERSGALTTIRRIIDAGVVAGIGHTDASYELTRDAINAGARVATHLFNAMRPIHHRDPGPAVALLDDPRVTVELVADNVHVHPALARHVIHAAGADRVALVSDAMAAAGMPDGQYRLGSLDVTVAAGIARLPRTGTIAGSTATMDRLFRHAVAQSRSPLPDALVEASQLTATTPARCLGLADVGALRPAHRADLVVLSAELGVLGVMAAGEWEVEPAGTATR